MLNHCSISVSARPALVDSPIADQIRRIQTLAVERPVDAGTHVKRCAASSAVKIPVSSHPPKSR